MGGFVASMTNQSSGHNPYEGKKTFTNQMAKLQDLVKDLHDEYAAFKDADSQIQGRSLSKDSFAISKDIAWEFVEDKCRKDKSCTVDALKKKLKTFNDAHPNLSPNEIQVVNLTLKKLVSKVDEKERTFASRNAWSRLAQGFVASMTNQSSGHNP